MPCCRAEREKSHIKDIIDAMLHIIDEDDATKMLMMRAIRYAIFSRHYAIQRALIRHDALPYGAAKTRHIAAIRCRRHSLLLFLSLCRHITAPAPPIFSAIWRY